MKETFKLLINAVSQARLAICGGIKMETVRTNCKSKISSIFPAACFILGVFIEVLIVILDKSAYVIQYDGWLFRITFLLFACKVCLTKYSLKEYEYLLFFIILGGLSYLITGRNEIIRFTVFVAACKNINIRQVLQGVFVMTLAGVIVLILLSLLGVGGTVAITTDFGRGVIETRYCLGLGHPNALHCMYIALMLLGIYLYHEKWRIIGYFVVIALNIGLFLLTDSRTSFIIGMCFILLAMIVQYVKVLQNSRWCYVVGILFIVFAVGLSISFACYCTSIPIYERLDSLLNGRIFALKDSVRDEGMIYTWSAFSESINDNYFDLGIVRAFFWYGWIPASFYYLLQIKLIWTSYQKKDYMLLVVMIAITAYTIIEAHFTSVYIGRNYVLFFMGMYLTELTGTGKGSREEYFPFIYRFLKKKEVEAV